MRGRSGFTLVELIIVAAIIAVIIAIAIAGMLRMRMNANEAVAAASMRAIATGQVAFKGAAVVDDNGDGEGDYGSLAQLAAPGANSAPFIEPVLGAGAKQGYAFTVIVTLGSATEGAAYTCIGVPITPGRSGFKRYFVDDSGVIRLTVDGTEAHAGSQELR